MAYMGDQAALAEAYRTRYDALTAKAWAAAKNDKGHEALNAISQTVDLEGEVNYRGICYGNIADLEERYEGEAITDTSLNPREVTGNVRQFSKSITLTQEMMESRRLKPQLDGKVSELATRAYNHPVDTLMNILTYARTTTYTNGRGKKVDIKCITDEPLFKTTHSWDSLSAVNLGAYSVTGALDFDEMKAGIDQITTGMATFKDTAGVPVNPGGLTVDNLYFIADNEHEAFFHRLRVSQETNAVRGDMQYHSAGYNSYTDVRLFGDSKNRLYAFYTGPGIKAFYYALVPGYPKTDMVWDFTTQTYKYLILTKYMLQPVNPLACYHIKEA